MVLLTEELEPSSTITFKSAIFVKVLPTNVPCWQVPISHTPEIIALGKASNIEISIIVKSTTMPSRTLYLQTYVAFIVFFNDVTILRIHLFKSVGGTIFKVNCKVPNTFRLNKVRCALEFQSSTQEVSE